jgi:hypothetical protein
MMPALDQREENRREEKERCINAFLRATMGQRKNIPSSSECVYLVDSISMDHTEII